MHCPPIEVCENADTYETMDRLVEKGKIGAYGISIYNLSEGYAALKNENVQSVQLVFNMFRQKPLDDFLQHAKEKNVAIIARGPLASGLLSGEITENSVFPENDHRNYNIDGSAFDVGDTFSGIPLKHGCRAVEEVKKLLPKSMTVSQLALRWILMHKEISTVIPGAVTAKQVEANSGISHLPEIQDLMGRIGSIYNNFLRSEVHEKWN